MRRRLAIIGSIIVGALAIAGPASAGFSDGGDMCRQVASQGPAGLPQ
jgi:hypothetical protein